MSIVIIIIFFVVLFAFSFAAKKKEITLIDPKSLNWFLVAFSAGTTANSGFIVTAAIAMGYAGGFGSILFPLSFFLGDFLYWQLFAPRINAFASENSVTTIPEFITKNVRDNIRPLTTLISISIIFSSTLYTIAQWNTTGILVGKLYDVDATICIVVFAAIVLAYCLFGGFKSSVYADVIQGIFMMLFTTFTVLFSALQIPELSNKLTLLFATFGDGFKFASENGIVFILGWAMAAIGFSFSQPHIVDKIIAAKDEANVRRAKFVYMFFVQYTWIGMTFLGILISLLIPNIPKADQEMSLAIFLKTYSNPWLEGIIITGVFATIASTAASLNISISNYLQSDIIRDRLKVNSRVLLTIVFFSTAFLSVLLVNSKVFDLTIFAVSLGAVIAACILIKIYRINHNRTSLIGCLVSSLIVTVSFKIFGINANILYDIPVGTIFGLLANYLIYRSTAKTAVLI